jgi:hypothetical protein
VFDEQDNLLTITNTNEFGAAYIKLNGASSKAISAKTLNGEVNITKHLFIGGKQDDKLAIREQQDFSNKA